MRVENLKSVSELCARKYPVWPVFELDSLDASLAQGVGCSLQDVDFVTFNVEL